jgi:predicted dehydrogenase
VLRACIVGAGQIAKQHLACLRQLPGVEIAGVCDRSPAAAEAAAERFGVGRWFADYGQMLREIAPDIVHVTTPFDSHFPLAMSALDAGAHVIVEKPMTVDPVQCRALLARAAALGRHVVEDHNYLFNASVQRLSKIVRSPDAGRIVHVEVSVCLDLFGPGSRMNDRGAPHPALATPGGAATEFLTHFASLTNAFVGTHRAVRLIWPEPMNGVDAIRGAEFRAMVEAEAGTASLLFSGTSGPDAAWLRVHCTNLRAEAGLFEPRLSVQRIRGGPRPLMPLVNGLAEAAAAVRGSVGGLWRKLAGGPGTYDGLWELLARTYAALRSGGEMPVTPAQIESVSRLVDALTDAANRVTPPSPSVPAGGLGAA